MNDNEALIETHPRDKLLVMRQNKLSLEKAEKIKERERKRQLRQRQKEIKENFKTITRAKSIESSKETLKKFAEHYLGEYYLSNFSIRERLELIKLCASYCKRWLTIFISPLVATLGAILYAGLFISAIKLAWLPIWLAFMILYLKLILKKQSRRDCINLFDYAEFLIYQRSLVENENNKLREEKNNFKT